MEIENGKEKSENGLDGKEERVNGVEKKENLKGTTWKLKMEN